MTLLSKNLADYARLDQYSLLNVFRKKPVAKSIDFIVVNLHTSRPLSIMGSWVTTVGVVGAVAVAGAAVLCNLPVNPFVKSAEKASLDWLQATTLKTIGSESKEFKASDLWKDNGAVIMAVRRPG